MAATWEPLVNLLNPHAERYVYDDSPGGVSDDDECYICLRKYGVQEGVGDKPACAPIRFPCGHIVGDECWNEHTRRSDDGRCTLCRQELPSAVVEILPPDDTLYGRALTWVACSAWYLKVEKFSIKWMKCANEPDRCEEARQMLTGRHISGPGTYTALFYVWADQVIFLFTMAIYFAIVASIYEAVRLFGVMVPWLFEGNSMLPLCERLLSAVTFGAFFIMVSSAVVFLAIEKQSSLRFQVITASCIGFLGHWELLAAYFVNWSAFALVTALLIQRAQKRSKPRSPIAL